MTENKPETNLDERKELLESLMETPEWKAVSDVGLDPVDVLAKYIDTAFKMHKDNAKPRLDFVISRFKNEIKIAAAVDNRGIILGTVDENFEDGSSKRRPETFVVLTNDGTLKKVVTFKHDMITQSGIYTLDLDFDAEKESYIARSVLDRKNLVKDPIEFFGNKRIAIRPSSSEWDDGSINTSKYQAVLVHGIVTSIRPIPKFATNEDGKSTIIGNYPIYLPNCREPVPDMQPILRIGFGAEGTTNYITTTFRQCTFGNPYFGVSGMSDAFAYAVEAESDPEKQIELIEHMFIGKEMAIVGYVTKINQYTDKEGNETNQIAIRGIACLDLDPECSGFAEIVEARHNVPKPTEIKNPVAKTVPNSSIAPVTAVNNQPDVDTTPASFVNTPTNVGNIMSVDAVIIEDAVEQDVEEDEDDSSKYPDFATDPEGFSNKVVENILTIIKMVHIEQSKVTVSYVKKTLMLEKANVPDAIWKTIVNIVKSSM